MKFKNINSLNRNDKIVIRRGQPENDRQNSIIIVQFQDSCGLSPENVVTKLQTQFKKTSKWEKAEAKTIHNGIQITGLFSDEIAYYFYTEEQKMVSKLSPSVPSVLIIK